MREGVNWSFWLGLIWLEVNLVGAKFKASQVVDSECVLCLHAFAVHAVGQRPSHEKTAQVSLWVVLVKEPFLVWMFAM